MAYSELRMSKVLGGVCTGKMWFKDRTLAPMEAEGWAKLVDFTLHPDEGESE